MLAENKGIEDGWADAFLLRGRLRSGADGALQDSDGETALHKACARVRPLLMSVVQGIRPLYLC